MTNQKKRMLVTSLSAIAVVVVLIVGLFGYRAVTGASQGDKSVTVTVALADGTQTVYEYRTKCEYLGELLLEENLAEGTQGDYGLYITTVAGVTADETQQQWWCITKAGESVTTGADATPIADKDQFEITLMEGY